MSISTSLSNALSGLGAAARAADLVSANVANALTQGYARRTLELSSRSLAGNGAGVQIDGVSRQVDQALLADRRLADATLSSAAHSSDFYSDLEAAIGTPDQPNSLGGRIAGFASALVTAASQPSSDQRLTGVLRAAQNLAAQFADISNMLQSSRADADKQIGKDVDTVNDALSRIAELNKDITVSLARGADATSLMDQRQLQVDRISPILPLREIPRAGGQIALFTPQGATLLDGRPSTLGFAPTHAVTAQMSLASGGLSGLTLNGQPLAFNGPNNKIDGGGLSALFALRDGAAPAAQAELDALARDLVDRFQTPAADPSLNGAAGLFTDSGALFDPLNEGGLSSRLAVNPLADPAQGGQLSLLRDGLGAATPGAVGDATQLTALSAALQSSRVPASGQFSTGTRTAAGLAADFLSAIGGDRQNALADETYAAARHDTLSRLELENGVDTDQEMANLLQIENAYSANARVISTVDDMIQTILRI